MAQQAQPRIVLLPLGAPNFGSILVGHGGKKVPGVDTRACTHLIDLEAFLESLPAGDELLLSGDELLFQLLRLLGQQQFDFARCC